MSIIATEKNSSGRRLGDRPTCCQVASGSRGSERRVQRVRPDDLEPDEGQQDLSVPKLEVSDHKKPPLDSYQVVVCNGGVDDIKDERFISLRQTLSAVFYHFLILIVMLSKPL